MKRSIPPFYLAAKVSRLSGMCLVWAVLLLGICLLTSPAYPQDVLWGLTSNAGPKGAGTAFSIKSTGEDFTLHHAFINEPVSPIGTLLEGSDGYFYGVTVAGGEQNRGTIFKISADGTGFTVLKSFNGSTDGSNPSGSLIDGNDGYLYGMTQISRADSGGSFNKGGKIFKISTDGSNFTVLKSFKDSTEVVLPIGSLIIRNDDYFYGVTFGGGDYIGTIFKISSDGTDYRVLKSFNTQTEGAPGGNLIQGSDGYLYGITTEADNYGVGSIFKVAPDGSNFTILKSFDIHNSTDGATPSGRLTEGSDGYLYGISSFGGNNNVGAIFKIASDGSGYTLLRSFVSLTDGAYPIADLIKRSDGYLYGITQDGGTKNGGTLFKIAPNGTDFTVLNNFDTSTESGANPLRSLVEGSDGYFYGTTTFNAGYITESSDYGSIFKIATDGSGFTILKNFNRSTDGDAPRGSLIEGSDGYFYGMTNEGGEYGVGTIFKVKADGTGFTILKSLNSTTDGAHPSGSLLEASDGYLYGMTAEGGTNNSGTIFKLAWDGSGFSVLKNFDLNNAIDGGRPTGSLIEGSDGKLYGVANQAAGINNNGTIFKLARDGSEFTILHLFKNSPDGANPVGSLVKGRDGYFYGMTYIGGGIEVGDYSFGTIFKISADGTNFNIIHRFTYEDGAYPQGNLIESSDGFLYGMTPYGGIKGGGIIFKIAPDGSDFYVLKSFVHYNSTEGYFPFGSLTEGSNGILYGMTIGGSPFEYPGHGTIFKINADGSDFAVLRNFNPSTDGDAPTGSLIIQKGKKGPLPALQVNFQNRWAKPPQGWIKDYGLPFAEKQIADSTLTFGWKRRDTAEPINLSVGGNFPGNEGNGRWRPTPYDPLLATLIHMQGDDVKNFRGTPIESYWELAVENGEYLVTVSVGDGFRYTYTDPESHSINIEGIPAITHFVPQGGNGSLSRFKQATVKATVTDGLLTIDADGGTNTKINYAIIQPLSSSAAIARKDFSSQGAETQVQIKAYPNPFVNSLTLTMPQWQGQVKVSLNNIVGMSLYSTQQEIRAGELSLNLAGLELTPGMYVLRLTAEDGTTKLLKLYRQ